MTFNSQIDLGQVITAIAVIAGLLGSLYVSQTRLNYIEKRQVEQSATLEKALDRINGQFDRYGDGFHDLASKVQVLIGSMQVRRARDDG